MPFAVGLELTDEVVAAALATDVVRSISLGVDGPVAPCVVWLDDTNEFVVGDQANQAAVLHPARVARRFVSRVADHEPIRLGTSDFAPLTLTAAVVKWALAKAGSDAAESVAIAHPSSWDSDRVSALCEAVKLAGARRVEAIPAPVAAVWDHKARNPLEPGTTVLVVEMGRTTFDTGLVRVTEAGQDLLAAPDDARASEAVNIEDTLTAAVLKQAGYTNDAIETSPIHEVLALRNDCRNALRALISAETVQLPVRLMGAGSTVSLTRQGLIDLIRPTIADALAVTDRVLSQAELRRSDIDLVLLTGTTARLPLLSEMVGDHFDRPLVVAPQPESAGARGASQRAALRALEATGALPQPTSAESAVAEPTPATDPGVATQSMPGWKQPDRRRGPLIAAVVAFVVAVLGVGAIGLMNNSDSGSAPQATSASPTSIAPENDKGVSCPVGEEPPCIRWEYQTGGAVNGTVTQITLADGVIGVFGAQDGIVHAVDVDTGEPRWTFPTEDNIFNSVASDGERAYVASNDGRLYALNADTGIEVWRYQTDAGLEITPVVAEGVVYGSSNDGTMFALESSDGTLLWEVEAGGPVSSSPLLVDDLVIFGARSPDSSLYAIEQATGDVRWKAPADVYYSSADTNGELVFAGTNDGRLVAIDLATGEESWMFQAGDNIGSSPAVFDNAVYFGSFDGNVYALDGKTGEELWQFHTGNDIVFSSAWVTDERVYIGSHVGNLYALDRSSGEEIWRFEFSELVGASPIEYGDIVYVGGDEGKLVQLLAR